MFINVCHFRITRIVQTAQFDSPARDLNTKIESHRHHSYHNICERKGYYKVICNNSVEILEAYVSYSEYISISWAAHSHLNFLTLTTDMMTSKLPKIAATMINIIMDAAKIVIKTLIHSWSISSSVLILLVILNVLLVYQ